MNLYNPRRVPTRSVGALDIAIDTDTNAFVLALTEDSVNEAKIVQLPPQSLDSIDDMVQLWRAHVEDDAPFTTWCRENATWPLALAMRSPDWPRGATRLETCQRYLASRGVGQHVFNALDLAWYEFQLQDVVTLADGKQYRLALVDE